MKRVLWLASFAVSVAVCACGGSGTTVTGSTGQDLSGSSKTPDDGKVQAGKEQGDDDVEHDDAGGQAEHAGRDGGHDAVDHDDAEAEHEDAEAEHEDAEAEHEDADLDEDGGEHHRGRDGGSGGPGPSH